MSVMVEFPTEDAFRMAREILDIGGDVLDENGEWDEERHREPFDAMQVAAKRIRAREEERANMANANG